MFVLESDFPGMFTRHPSFFSVGTARAVQGAALPKEILDTQLYLYSYMLHHLYCCLSRWASIATCRSLAANKDFWRSHMSDGRWILWSHG